MSVWIVDDQFEQGITFERLYYLDDDSDELIDTAGWTADFVIRTEPGAPTAILSGSTEDGRIQVGINDDDPDNVFNVRISIPGTVTAAVEHFGKAAYELRLTNPLGEPSDAVKGFMYFSPGVI